MSVRSISGQGHPPARCVFDKTLFIVLALHWALLVAAVPVFAFVSNKTVFSVYWSVGFFSFLILAFTKPTRYLFNISGRVVCADLKRFSIIIRIIMIPLALMVIYCFIMLREGGPSIDNGIYCLWNHGFIREITQEEYIRLSRIERTFFSSMLALIRSGFMLCCCYADQIV